MSLSRGPKIVTNGLVLYLDAGNTNSYSRTVTTWSNGWAGSYSNPTYSFDGNLSTYTIQAGTATYTFAGGGLNVTGTVRIYVTFGATSGQVAGLPNVIVVDGTDVSSKMAAANLYAGGAGAGWIDVTSEVGAVFNTIVMTGTSGRSNPAIYAVEVNGQILVDGLTSSWIDLCNTGNIGRLTNGPTLSEVNLGGITFDGTNDYVDLSANSNLLNLGNTFTIESVFKLTNTSQTIGTIFSSLDVATSSQTKGVSFHWYKTGEYGLSANILRAQLGLASWAWNVFGSNGITITDTNYHHVALTISSGNTSPVVVFYIDGVSQSATRWTESSTGALNYGTDVNSLRLGSRYPSSNPGYDTSYSALTISILKIYNRALSATEITQNYNATKRRFGL